MHDATTTEEPTWHDLYTGDERDYMPPDPLALTLTEGLDAGAALDVGCGAGGLLVALAKRGWGVTGIDFTPKAIAAARAVFARHDVEGQLEVADARSWSPPRTYDLILSTFALPAKRATRMEAYRVMREALAPGGTIIIKDFDPRMETIQSFPGYEMVPVEELLTGFDGLEIVRAEVVETPKHDHGHGTSDGPAWSAALLVARKPA